MKISTERLKQIIKEELNEDLPGWTRHHRRQKARASAEARSVFAPMEKMYYTAKDWSPQGTLEERDTTPEEKKQLEESFITVFDNIIKTWQEERESPDAWKSGY